QKLESGNRGNHDNDKHARSLRQPAKYPVPHVRSRIPPRADGYHERLRKGRGNDRTRTGVDWVWRCHCDPVTVLLSLLKPGSLGYCIALIAVTSRSLTLSGSGT